MRDLCPHCGGDLTDSSVDRLARWARANNVQPVMGSGFWLEHAALLLGCSKATLYREMARGNIECRFIRGRRWITFEEIERYAGVEKKLSHDDA